MGEIVNKQPTDAPQALRKARTRKPKSSSQKEIIKIGTEINEIETKRTTQESVKQRVGSLKRE
jgi:hypothetical protein